MAQPKRPDQSPVEQPGDDVGEPYKSGAGDDDDGPHAKPEGDIENPEDGVRDPNVERRDIEKADDEAGITLQPI